jgi:hypothetical protein
MQGELLGCLTMAIGHVNSKMPRKCPIQYVLGPVSLTCKPATYAGEGRGDVI